MSNRFIARTYRYWLKASHRRNYPFFLQSKFTIDFPLFLHSVGPLRSNKWYLDKHDRTLPHDPANSFWNKTQEKRTVYHRPRAPDSSNTHYALIHLEHEDPHKNKTFYLGSGSLQQCNRLYDLAKELKDNNEINPEWTNKQLREAIK